MSHQLKPATLFLATQPAVDQGFAGVADVGWGAPAVGQSSGITFTAPGIFTLQPGREYELETTLVFELVTNLVTFIWVDAANSTAFTTFNTNALLGPTTILGAHIHTIARFKPLVATDVHVRQTQVGGNAALTALSSVTIKTID